MDSLITKSLIRMAFILPRPASIGAGAANRALLRFLSLAPVLGGEGGGGQAADGPSRFFFFVLGAGAGSSRRRPPMILNLLLVFPYLLFELVEHHVHRGLHILVPLAGHE